MTISLPRVLVVDDERTMLDVVSRFAEKEGFETIRCSGGRDALDQLQAAHADIALVDLRMPDVNGMEVLEAIRRVDPACRVVLMTGYAGIDSAIEAIKQGATDYLTKPLDLERVRRLLRSVREEAHRRRALLQAESQLARRTEYRGMIGPSAPMQDLFSLIERLAPHVRTALIIGETGTGKELVARALHQAGPRRSQRFVPVNCSAVVESLFESELFGHVRGAFTGATDTKAGLFEHASGGTLFLDEVGELPLAVQAKLLRVLESGEVQRIGALDARHVDVQVFAATNRDLSAEVQAGRFRADLFYRLDLVELRIPPLRARREDIPYLVAAFVAEFAKRFGKRVQGIAPDAERRLAGDPWTGNVRQLRNTIERACMLAEGDVITEREVGPIVMVEARAPASSNPAPVAESSAPSVPESLLAVERDHVVRVLERTGGNKQAAARELQISRRALYRLLERHHLNDLINRRLHGEACDTTRRRV
jgi:DNA-binding NtrC family response regulator